MTTTGAQTAADVERAVAYLGSARRRPFFAALVQAVALEARGAYPASGTEVPAASEGFVCLNELLQIVGSRLSADFVGGGEFDDRAFVEALVEEARRRGCVAALRSALAGVESRLPPEAATTAKARAINIKDSAVANLASEQRLPFLAELVYWLSLEARGLYPPDGTDARQAVRPFICNNKAFQRLASQLRADSAASDGGYSDRALVEALLRGARQWGCEAGVRAALARALAAVEP